MRDVSTGVKEEDRSRRAWWRSTPQRPVNPGEPSAILVVDTDYIGDVILATPVLTALRRRFPTAHLTLATSPEAAPLLVAHPALDQVVELEPRPGLGRALRLLRQLRALRPHDIVVGLNVIPARGWVAVLAAWFCGARQRLSVQPDAADNLPLHWSAIYPRVLRPLGIVHPPASPQLATSPQARRTVQQFLDNHAQPERRPWIGVNPGGRIYNLSDPREHGRIARLSRRWPAERFAALVARLLDDGATVFLTGSTEDASTTSAIARMLDETVSDRLIDATGCFSLTETAALIERMDVFVSNDTGPMHVAFSLNVPTVALFGPTDPRVTGPLVEFPHQILQPHLPCSPCCGRKLVICRNPAGQECLSAVSVDAAHAAVERTLAARACTPPPTQQRSFVLHSNGELRTISSS